MAKAVDARCVEAGWTSSQKKITSLASPQPSTYTHRNRNRNRNRTDMHLADGDSTNDRKSSFMLDGVEYGTLERLFGELRRRRHERTAAWLEELGRLCR